MIPRRLAQRFRRAFSLLVGCLAALAILACGQSDRRSRGERSSITILYPPDERLFAYDMPVKFLVFLPLVTRNAQGEIEPVLAKSWEHSPDYRQWTVHLRTDVRWHDGVPVTAHDVKFTLDLLAHPAVLWASPNAYRVTVLDDSTYSIVYDRRAGGHPLEAWTVFYHKHLLDALDPAGFGSWAFWTHPVGNGPYRYVRHVAKTMMELEANPDYFRGTPRIRRIVLKFSGGSPVTELSSGVDVAYVQTLDAVKLGQDSRFRVYYSVDPANIKGVAWNQRHTFFRDRRVRRALTLAINRRELHQALGLPEHLPVFDVPFTADQFRRGEVPEALPYDPALAGRLLEEAGWRDSDGDGVRDRDGRAFRFTLFGGPENVATYVQAQLRRVGLQTEITAMYTDVAWDRVRRGQFEAALLTLSIDGDWGHLTLYGEGSPIGYSSPAVASLLQQAHATMDPDEADRIHRELATVFQRELPITYLYPYVWFTVAHRRIRGLSTPHLSDPVVHSEGLWLEPEDE